MYLCSTELVEIKLLICIKMDLTLNNLQWLICHKTKSNPQAGKEGEITQHWSQEVLEKKKDFILVYGHSGWQLFVQRLVMGRNCIFKGPHRFPSCEVKLVLVCCTDHHRLLSCLLDMFFVNVFFLPVGSNQLFGLACWELLSSVSDW